MCLYLFSVGRDSREKMNRCRSIAVSVMQKTCCSVPFDFDLVLTLARQWPWLLWFCWPQFLFDVSEAKGKRKGSLRLGGGISPLSWNLFISFWDRAIEKPESIHVVCVCVCVCVIMLLQKNRPCFCRQKYTASTFRLCPHWQKTDQPISTVYLSDHS